MKRNLAQNDYGRHTFYEETWNLAFKNSFQIVKLRCMRQFNFPLDFKLKFNTNWNRVWHSYRFWHERISEYIRIFLIWIFIWIFVRIKILIRIYSYIRSSQKISYEYIRIFVRVIFLTWIYSDIRSCQNPYKCHTLLWLPKPDYLNNIRTLLLIISQPRQLKNIAQQCARTWRQWTFHIQKNKVFCQVAGNGDDDEMSSRNIFQMSEAQES